jgi:hypothetical protein
VIAKGRRFSGGGNAHVENAVKAQGGLYVRLKSMTVHAVESTRGTRRYRPAPYVELVAVESHSMMK